MSAQPKLVDYGHPLVCEWFNSMHLVLIPVRLDTRRPYLSQWNKRGIATIYELHDWKEQWQDMLLGAVMGKCPIAGSDTGYWVLDVDRRSGGESSLAALEAVIGPLPRTCCFKTPGGFRLVFKWAPGLYIRTNASVLGSGLDVRGHRADGSGTGQTVIPPSVRPDGKYEWHEGHHFNTAGDAPPAWLFLVGFSKKERDTLAALGIDGPEGFDGAPPAEWRAIYLLKVQAHRGALRPRGAPTSTKPLLVMPGEPLDERTKARAVAYVATAIEGCCKEIAAAGKGQELTLNNNGLRINSLLKGLAYLGVDAVQLESEAFEQYEAACVAMKCLEKGNPWTPGDALKKWEHTSEDADPAELLSKFVTDPLDPFGDVQQPPGATPASAPVPIRVSSLAGKPVPPREFHVPGIPTKSTTGLFGDGAAGKSLLGGQLAVATVLAKQWIGHEVQRPGPVLFIGAEDDTDEMHRRLETIAEKYGASLADLKDLHLLCLAGEDALLGVADRNEVIQPTPLWNRISEFIMDVRPTLVVYDTLADLFAGNENSRVQARQFVTMLRRPAMQTNGSALLLAHPSLSGMASGTGSSGSTGWNNSVRSRMYFSRVRGLEGKEADPDARVLEVKKANYGPAGNEMTLYWQDGVFVPDRDKPVQRRTDKELHAESMFLGLLREFTDSNRNVSCNHGHAYAPAVFAKEPKAQGFTKGDFSAAMSRLFTKQLIRNEVTGPPSRRINRLALCT